MIKFKGIYDWKLINADTGKVDLEGSQNNNVSDCFLDFFFVGGYLYPGIVYPATVSRFSIQLSNSATIPGVDYRYRGMGRHFNILVEYIDPTKGIDYVNQYKWVSYNFTPPVSPRTITIIGVSCDNSSGVTFTNADFASFIELSVPITQNTNQYLFVRYRVYVTFESMATINTYPSRFFDWAINHGIFTEAAMCIGGTYGSGYSKMLLTNFREPENGANVLRYITPVFTISTIVNLDVVIPTSINLNGTAGITSAVGAIGATFFGDDRNAQVSTHYSNCIHNAFGSSPVQNLSPGVSRVFLHTPAYESSLYSDVSDIPESRGIVSISGTPVNNFHIIGRVRITKTGDASNIIDEVVNYTDVNTGDYTFLVTQDLTTGDIFRLTTTDTLPSPLLTGTSYYAIRVDSTHIKLALTYANAQLNIPIILTTQGAGDHTLNRYNTGRYRIQAEPDWSGFAYIIQLSMAMDYDGYVMPINLTLNDYYNEGIVSGEADIYTNSGTMYRNPSYNKASGSMLRGSIKFGEYIYSVQASRRGGTNNICRWYFNSIETSIPICKFGNTSTVVESIIKRGDYVYIATSPDGIYEYDLNNPTVAPSLVSITGMSAFNIQDMCMDEVTQYLWTGHTNGICKIDPSTWTATLYTNGAGQALQGMTTNQVNVQAGHLDVYNGLVLRGGYSYMDNSYANTCQPWLFKVATEEWQLLPDYCYSCCIVPSTGQVLWRGGNALYIYNVVFSGKNGGSYNIAEQTTGIASISFGAMAGYAQIYDDVFIFVYLDSYRRVTVEQYTLGGTLQFYLMDAYGLLDTPIRGLGWGHCLGALKRTMFDIGNGLKAAFVYNLLVRAPFPDPKDFGWNGSSWVLGNVNDRPIPDTVSQDFINGLSGLFTNAVGEQWDTQFVEGEHFNFVHGPFPVKDNLQEVTCQGGKYNGEAYRVQDSDVVVPNPSRYVYIPEISDPDFRDMDIGTLANQLYDGSTLMGIYTLGSSINIGFSGNNVVTGTNIPSGTPIMIYAPWNTANLLPFPLQVRGVYFAININTTTIQLANTYEDAVAPTPVPIVFLTPAIENAAVIYLITPTVADTYYAGVNGVFIFATADIGKTITLNYIYTKFSA